MYRKAIELRPVFAKAYGNLGNRRLAGLGQARRIHRGLPQGRRDAAEAGGGPYQSRHRRCIWRGDMKKRWPNAGLPSALRPDFPEAA